MKLLPRYREFLRLRLAANAGDEAAWQAAPAAWAEFWRKDIHELRAPFDADKAVRELLGRGELSEEFRLALARHIADRTPRKNGRKPGGLAPLKQGPVTKAPLEREKCVNLLLDFGSGLKPPPVPRRTRTQLAELLLGKRTLKTGPAGTDPSAFYTASIAQKALLYFAYGLAEKMSLATAIHIAAAEAGLKVATVKAALATIGDKAALVRIAREIDVSGPKPAALSVSWERSAIVERERTMIRNIAAAEGLSMEATCRELLRHRIEDKAKALANTAHGAALAARAEKVSALPLPEVLSALRMTILANELD
jgi:hypothetical protein